MQTDLPIEEQMARLKTALHWGATPAMATPLRPDGTLNSAEIAPLVDFLVDKGAAGLFVGGTTGEGVLLTTAERQRLHAETVAAAAGRVPVILHIGALRTDESMRLMQHAAEIGADAAAAVTPFFYRLDDEALFDFYAALAETSAELPLFTYDIPQYAGNGISPTLMERLYAAYPSVAGVKTSRHDAPGVRKLVRVTPDSRMVLVGSEQLALGLLALGVDGLISGIATAVPEPFVALCQAFADGDMAAARQAQTQVDGLLAITGSRARMGVIKAILTARGIDVGSAVAPLLPPESDPWPAVQTVLAS